MTEAKESRWLQVLREQCTLKPQSKVGEEIGYSASVINQVLKGVYPGSLSKVESAVRGAYMGETVSCPVLGELEHHLCLAYQKRKYAATNPLRIKLYRACNTGCTYKRNHQEKNNVSSDL